MTLSGQIELEATQPPKMARELKDRLTDLLSRYSFNEIMTEMARQCPAFDIHITAHPGEGKRKNK